MMGSSNIPTIPSPAAPMPSFESGVETEEYSFEWKIKNFAFVLKQPSNISSQSIEFSFGDSLGLASNWCTFLEAKVEGGPKFGIFNKVKKRPEQRLRSLYVQGTFAFKNAEGGIARRLDTGPVDIYSFDPSIGYGFGEIFDANVEPPYLVDGALVVMVTVKLFSSSNPQPTVEERLKGFQLKSTANARAALAGLLDNPVPCHDIQVVSSENEAMTAQKGVLAARSPVFLAMLQHDMQERDAGEIRIADMGTKTLKLFLRFLYTGELLPDWKDPGVLLELTNAAAKYELADLLQFLDGVLGSVCDLYNVGMLIPLAHRLSLNKAEVELLSFARRNGTSSSQNYIKMLSGVSASMGGGNSEGEGDDDEEDQIAGHSRSRSPHSSSGRGGCGGCGFSGGKGARKEPDRNANDRSSKRKCKCDASGNNSKK